MNCLDVRRAVLTEPRIGGADVQEHLDGCAECARAAAGVTDLDRNIANAFAVPAPDALADRIMFTRRQSFLPRYAMAAAVIFGLALGITLGADQLNGEFSDATVTAVGPAHPAVVAIAEVVDEGHRVPIPEEEATMEIENGFKRLGLGLKPGEATAQYIGKCRVTSGECEHIVVTTADAQANVMLVPGHSVGERVLVSDQHLTALVNPAGAGGYIVVADSAKTAKRMSKLLKGSSSFFRG